jgi:Flp pilus assembly protein TadD
VFRSKPVLFALLFFVSISSLTFAQRGSRSQPNEVDIQVRVTLPNDQPAPEQLRVDLINSSNVSVVEDFTNSVGQAVFHINGSGTFHVKVSGPNIDDAVSEDVQVSETDRVRVVFVQVHPKSDPNASSAPENKAMTSASQLKIPPAARKSFDKGLEALQRKDYNRAVEWFQKATAAYPQYDAAFDNLGVAFMSLGQADKAREAFEHAVQLNDKNADADRNYARLLIGDKQYAAAKDLLQKALIVDPQDPSSLTLLAVTQFKTGDYDGALESAMKVHKISHEGFAVAHYVAGRAFENKHQYENATTEYQMYLRESPDGPEASQVRASLARVTASAKATPQ